MVLDQSHLLSWPLIRDTCALALLILKLTFELLYLLIFLLNYLLIACLHFTQVTLKHFSLILDVVYQLFFLNRIPFQYLLAGEADLSCGISQIVDDHVQEDLGSI